MKKENKKEECDCYCHKKGAHCCDDGKGICAGCGKVSEWVKRKERDNLKK